MLTGFHCGNPTFCLFLCLMAPTQLLLTLEGCTLLPQKRYASRMDEGIVK